MPEVLIYTKYNRPFKDDRTLIREFQNAKTEEQWKEAAYELWEKYIRVVQIGRRELIQACLSNGYYMQDIIEEYPALFWETFIRQLYGVDLNKVKHVEEFSIYIRVMGYLKSMNRDFIANYLSWNTKTESIEKSSEDDISNIDKQAYISNFDRTHRDYEGSQAKKVFWESLEIWKKMLTPTQKTMVNMLVKGKGKTEIKVALRIPEKVYISNMFFIKDIFKKTVLKISKKYKTPFSYNEMLEELQ